MVQALEAEAERRKAQSAEWQAKLKAVEKEFEGYKVRAQNVLRQQQPATTASSDQKQEASLERVIQTLNQKVSDLSTRLSASQLEYNHINEDHERLMERHSQLLQEMAAKEKAARDKHDQLLKLANQAERTRQDAAADWQQETETLKQSYEVSWAWLLPNFRFQIQTTFENIFKNYWFCERRSYSEIRILYKRGST